MNPDDRTPSPQDLLQRAILGEQKRQTGVDRSMDAIAHEFEGFEILRLLGTGGMGSVYEAKQLSLDRKVAIKVLHPALTQLDDEGMAAEFRERFIREAKAMAALKHPNIVTVYDFGFSRNGLLYLIMELVDGGDLANQIAKGAIPPDQVLRLTQKICAALEYAHQQGLVHRDIKPANILLTDDAEPKVTDFGLSKLLASPDGSEDLTMSGAILGTPEYMAPEQAGGTSEVDHRADVFSVGVLLYEMLTAERLRGKWRPPSTVRKEISPKVDPVVEKSLEPEVEARFQSAGEFGDSIHRLLSKSDSRKSLLSLTFVTGGAVAAAAFLLFQSGFKSSPQGQTKLLVAPTLRPGDSVDDARKQFAAVLKDSRGFLGEDFAFFLDMPSSVFKENLPVGELGFRPELLRVWPNSGSKSSPRIAGIWKKGTQEWRIGFELAGSVTERNEGMTAEGWTLTDRPPGVSNKEYAVWTRDHPLIRSSFHAVQPAGSPPMLIRPPSGYYHLRGTGDLLSKQTWRLFVYTGPPAGARRKILEAPISDLDKTIETFISSEEHAKLRSIEWGNSFTNAVAFLIALKEGDNLERKLVHGSSLTELENKVLPFFQEGWSPYDISIGGEMDHPYFFIVLERFLTP